MKYSDIEASFHAAQIETNNKEQRQSADAVLCKLYCTAHDNEQFKI